MRLRIEISTAARQISWENVLKPGRAVCYALLARSAPDLGTQLHDQGWGKHGFAPFGYGPPTFPAAPRKRGAYATSGRGYLELGSPLPEVVAGWAAALASTEIIDWGGVALHVHRVSLADNGEYSAGRARFRTRTPVVMKGSGQDDGGDRTTRQAWVLPSEPEFAAYFQGNLRRKAETLGLDPEVELEQVTWVGPKRSFAVGSGSKPGAAVEVQVSGSPQVLGAIRDWGLGQANAAGFGWVTL